MKRIKLGQGSRRNKAGFRGAEAGSFINRRRVTAIKYGMNINNSQKIIRLGLTGWFIVPALLANY